MRRYLYRTVLAGVLAGMMALQTGCTAETPEEAATEETSDTLEIGMTFDSFLIERWQRDRDVFVTAAQDLGATVNVQNANGEVQTQVEQIDYFIDKGVDAIVIIQVTNAGNEVLADAIMRAENEGIPVIAYDRLPLHAGVDLYVSFDNEAVGRLMGEHMREHLGSDATIIQVCGPTQDGNAMQMQVGFQSAMEGSDIDVAQTVYSTGWLAETGFNVTSKYLSDGGLLDGVMCGNDSIAGQAIRALSERRLAGSVCVVGQDADLDACQRIVEGTQCMTVYKPIEQLARRAAELVVQLARGEEITVNNTASDGTNEIPYESIDPVAVTKENMDDVITGVYHERSDIYLNVQE